MTHPPKRCDLLTPGQRARLARIKAAYSATDPRREVPLVVIGRINCELDNDILDRAEAAALEAMRDYPSHHEPLISIGPGGDYSKDYTPDITGPQRRYEQAVVWSLACVAIGAALMAVLVMAMNLWPGR